jgi:predicted RNA-binding protein YlxR (DUF448 family)
MAKNIPIRTCVACRSRLEQNVLLRLQSSNNSIISYSGFGRSFYLCGDCIENKRDLVVKKMLYYCGNKDKSFIKKNLEEIVVNAKS